MKTFLIILLVNYIIGCIVLASIDNEENELFNWASSNQYLYPITIQFWFVILIIWLFNKKQWKI